MAKNKMPLMRRSVDQRDQLLADIAGLQQRWAKNKLLLADAAAERFLPASTLGIRLTVLLLNNVGTTIGHWPLAIERIHTRIN